MTSGQNPQATRDRARIQADFDTMTAAMERLGASCPLMGESFFLSLPSFHRDYVVFDLLKFSES